MVGAPRFELGTPSPPDWGPTLISHSFFANGLKLPVHKVNSLTGFLQTFLVAARL
jgi:hypothetical protein